MDGMDGMDGMGGMGGMGLGTEINYAFARDYWYIAAVVVGFLAAVHAVNCAGARQRLKACHDASVEQPTRPDGPLSQSWATATALAREVSLPQAYLAVRGLRWATPPPLGRVLVLVAYWAVVVYMMCWRAAGIGDASSWERVGYRNGWVALAQLPMLYLVAGKTSPVAWLVGSSHERLSWLHRWVARTLLVTASVHGFRFWAGWARADLVSFELSLMPLVRYGLGAWGLLLWSVVVGMAPIRRAAYELWLLQHLATSIIMLWLLYRHIPANARYLLYMSIAFYAFDRAARGLLLLWCNVRWRRPGRASCSCSSASPPPPLSSSSSSACRASRWRLGHDVFLRTVGDSITIATITHVHFTWRPGQHIYLWVPRLGPLEAHPYTTACAPPPPAARRACACASIDLVVRAQAGFSRRLHALAARRPARPLLGLISGPYGAPPRWEAYETLVLLSASTGASFTLPMLEAAAARPTCVRRIEMALLARTAHELAYFVPRARAASREARSRGIDVRLHVAVTGARAAAGGAAAPLVQRGDSSPEEKGPAGEEEEEEKEEAARARDEKAAGHDCGRRDGDEAGGKGGAAVREYGARLDVEALIRGPVEQAGGETAVIVCGGRELVARTRNCVSRLSDERAVHKGTGAQGIRVHAEEYSL